MPEKRKRKRDLYATFEHIERFHRRRMIFAIDAVFMLGLLFVIWSNWYASYAQYGKGFENSFFSDRLIFSVVLALFLIGHFVIMRLLESKDRMIIEAIRQHEDEIDDDDLNSDDLNENENWHEEIPAPTETIDNLESSERRSSRRSSPR